MKIKIPALAAFALLSTFSTTALAEWSVAKHPLGPGYTVVHDSNSPGLVNNTTYKTKRGVKKAAKALNQAEQASTDGNHEGGKGLD